MSAGEKRKSSRVRQQPARFGETSEDERTVAKETVQIEDSVEEQSSKDRTRYNRICL